MGQEREEEMTTIEPDLTKVIPWSKFLELDFEDLDAAQDYYERARDYLEYYDWCLEITESYAGMIYPGIVGVFLFKIVPDERADDWYWVVVGDLPPAYLVVDICPNPAAALDGYIGEMQLWVEAAAVGKPVDELIPVNAPPTKEYAEMLGSRLDFLIERILSEYEEDLKDLPEAP